jgi:hypothetical protein
VRRSASALPSPPVINPAPLTIVSRSPLACNPRLAHGFQCEIDVGMPHGGADATVAWPVTHIPNAAWMLVRGRAASAPSHRSRFPGNSKANKEPLPGNWKASSNRLVSLRRSGVLIMTAVPFTQCCSMLAVEASTLRQWLKRSNLSLASHPTDARIKCTTHEQVQQLATLHGRSIEQEQPPAPQPRILRRSLSLRRQLICKETSHLPSTFRAHSDVASSLSSSSSRRDQLATTGGGAGLWSSFMNVNGRLNDV